MAPTSSKEKRWKSDVLNNSLINVFNPEGWYLVCGLCSEVSGKEVRVNSNHAFAPTHRVAHCQSKTHKTAVRRIKARREAESVYATSTRKKKQRTIFGDGFTGSLYVSKGMKKVSKDKISTTAKPYVFFPKRYDFMFCSIVMYFSYVLSIQR